MHRIATLVVGIVLGVLTLVPASLPVVAQDATPTGGASGFPITPDPAECTAQPIADERLRVVLSPTGPTPTPADASFTLPEGTPADQETIDAYTATIRHAYACYNAGNFLAYFSFITDRFLAQPSADGVAFTEEDLAFFAATPEVIDPSVQITIVDIRNVTVLDDGRVGALIDTSFPYDPTTIETDYFILAEDGGTWKIDDIAENLEGQFPSDAMATPSA